MTDPNILALATSGAWCSVALRRPLAGRMESHCITVPGQGQQSVNILGLIDEVCRAASLDPAALDAVAFDAGPGSFTGLRIACAVAQGLGFAFGIPLLPVGSLRALAWQRIRLGPEEATVLAARDARMNEIYMAAYRVLALEDHRHGIDAAARFEAVHEPVLVPRAQFDQLVEEWVGESRSATAGMPVLHAGDVWLAVADVSADKDRNRPPLSTVGSDDGAIRADAIAELARVDWQAGHAVPAAAAAPFYLREKVALDLEEQRAARG